MFRMPLKLVKLLMRIGDAKVLFRYFLDLAMLLFEY